jgi:hypothetical protein
MRGLRIFLYVANDDETIMGCPSIDCTNLTESHTITVLPDIVGIGVSKAGGRAFQKLILFRSYSPSF